MKTQFFSIRTAIQLLYFAVFICSITLMSALGQQAAAPADPIEGKWYGITGFPTDRVEIGFEFKRNDKNELKAYLYQPVVNFYGLEVPGVVSKVGDKYVLKEWSLSLALHDGKLEGTYFALNGPISLERVEKLPSEVPVPALSKGPGPLWQLKLGASIYAPAAVRDGIAYVGTTGGMFYAINIKDGSFAWPFNAGRPIHGAALATAEHLYFVCDNGYLFKLERTTGKEIWRYDLGDAQVSRTLPHQVVDNSGDFDWDSTAPRPVLADGVIFVGSGDKALHAVNAVTGQRVWRFETQGKIRTDAVIDGQRIIVGSFDNYVYEVDRQSGKEVWRKDTRGPVTGSPALVGDQLIVGNRNGLLAALNPATGQTIWRMLFWGSAVESSAVPAGDGLFYIGASDMRRVSLIDSKEGRVLWRTDVFGLPWPSPAVTDKSVYVSTVGSQPYQMRHLGAFSALDRKSGKILWRWPLPETPGALYSGFVAPPVIEGQTVIVGGLDGTLYCFPVEP
jgi:outer membrane protein assembly factor BamB